MGAGIAKEFRRRYPDMPESLLRKNPTVGSMLLYVQKPYMVANLITKEKYWHKPTYETLTNALVDFNKPIQEFSNIIEEPLYIAMPYIGCGLDRLEWSKVKPILEDVFKDTDVEILVCGL